MAGGTGAGEAGERSAHARDRWPAAALGALLVLSAALGLWRLGAKSIWFDESISVLIGRMGTDEFLRTIGNDEANMSAYYLILRGWGALGGWGEVWVRSLSVLIAVATVAVLYLVARRLFDVRVAIVAALLLSVNGFFVQFEQEARSYILVMLLGIAAIACFERAVATRRIGWWAAYVLVSAVAVYGHLFALFLPLGQVAALLARPPDRREWRQAIVAWCTTGLLVLPALRVAYVRRDTQVFWNPPITLGRVRGVWAAAAGGGGAVLALAMAAAVLVGLVAAWRIWRGEGRTDRSWRVALAVGGYVVPTAAIFAASAAQQIIQLRYFAMTLPALALVASFGLSQLRWRWFGAVATIALVALSVLGLVRWYGAEKEDWRGAVAVVRDGAGPGDAVVLLDPFRRPLVDYYDPQANERRVAPLVSPARDFDLFPLYARRAFLGRARLAEVAAAHDTVWVYVSDVDLQRDMDAMRATLGATHDRTAVTQLESVSVERWDRR